MRAREKLSAAEAFDLRSSVERGRIDLVSSNGMGKNKDDGANSVI